jgi:hypothetical protein
LPRGPFFLGGVVVLENACQIVLLIKYFIATFLGGFQPEALYTCSTSKPPKKIELKFSEIE